MDDIDEDGEDRLVELFEASDFLMLGGISHLSLKYYSAFSMYC